VFSRRKLMGITRYQIAKAVYNQTGTMVDDMLTLVYKVAEKQARKGPTSELVVSLKDLEEIITHTIKLTYKKLDEL